MFLGKKVPLFAYVTFLPAAQERLSLGVQTWKLGAVQSVQPCGRPCGPECIMTPFGNKYTWDGK